MDRLVGILVGLGIPGLVLVAVSAACGLAGGAATVTALATLGGPLGMLGGIGALVLMGIVCNAIGKYGFDAIFLAVLKGLMAKGTTKAEIRRKIDTYPISNGLKQKIKRQIVSVGRRA